MKSLSHKLVAVLVVVLIGAFALFLVGCGEDEAAEETTTTEAEETTTTEAAEDDGEEQAEMLRIGITQIVAHPALDAVVEGFKDAMAEEGYVEGEDVSYDEQNAQGEMANASSIADKFVGDDVDLILSVATPTSQAAVQAAEGTGIPVIFSAVTDPVAAGLVTNAEAPEGTVTGVSDRLPLEPHVDLIEELVPNAETVGLLYNAGEANSVALVEEEKELAQDRGLETVDATASNSAEVLATAESLIGRVDVMSVLTDNTIVSALESVVNVAGENDIPLIAGDLDSVKRGAVAAYAFDYYQHGRQTGQMVANILQGQAIAETPVAFADELQLAINTAAAEQQGVSIPDEMMEEATEVYETIGE